jgi:hypothetical protein
LQDKFANLKSEVFAGKTDIEKNDPKTEVWESHRKVSGVEQSTFTVERKLNVEIDMNDQDRDRKEWSINYADHQDESEKKDVGKEKIEN